MTVTDELVQGNERFAQTFDKGDLPMPPGRTYDVRTGRLQQVKETAVAGR